MGRRHQPADRPAHASSGGVSALAFSQDARFLLTVISAWTRRWDAPAPLPDDVTRLTAWVEAATGLELDESGHSPSARRDAWLERRQRLEELGGPPPADPRRGWTQSSSALIRRPGATAERSGASGTGPRPPMPRHSAPDRLTDGPRRPGPPARGAWPSRPGRGDARRSGPADPRRLRLRNRFGLVLCWSGDRAGWRRSVAALLDRFGGTSDYRRPTYVAAACVMAAEATDDPGVPIRLAEIAVRGADASDKPNCLNTLGAALYRAGRYDEAIGRLEEAIRLRGGASVPDDWQFLAMAHHRLGHRDEARRWLDRLREHQPSAGAERSSGMSWRSACCGRGRGRDPLRPDVPR